MHGLGENSQRLVIFIAQVGCHTECSFDVLREVLVPHICADWDGAWCPNAISGDM